LEQQVLYLQQVNAIEALVANLGGHPAARSKLLGTANADAARVLFVQCTVNL
jgi:hypothetical protein